ncbi:8-amino-7-oxononanoate synthase [Vibrio sp. 10N.286.49.C2]|uniref:8-amino-7-oxononanoate synthase n=1 Tax=unclassified Vibrio TaxID=2614977 RepID=UPI000C81507F|nr:MULTISPECIES: 8-amino-7-oxononanoate synthase [unclassified Vibrio]PMH33710.1 8-amino-7-oxononanoate synthase [Vibrio sp. 10N.286.49.C2]PMH43967.1 8-amino-7-oxononanoate synthase [Vibrio sp. 10N.286.49.B1]PMH78775.1 8-amino-7-oxononanoate synthase [Vibrio sp. 10N.286.48.B7]
MPAFDSRIGKAIAQRDSQGLLRKTQAIISGNRRRFELDGTCYLNFSSNDYLGLAASDELGFAYQQAIAKHGVGSGASPLVTGYSSAHASLASALTQWLGFERALFFSSGFSANQAVLFALLEKGDMLLQDRLNHASLMEAGLLSPATMKRYRHTDMTHLSAQLSTSQPTLAVTESVFSMDGDVAPLDEFLQRCQQSYALTMIDDAHGIGVLGEDGKGALSETRLQPDILVVTFGKAFGLNGAAVLCSKAMGEYLTQFARHYVYSTSFSAAHASALLTALTMIQTQHWRREKLNELNGLFAENAGNLPPYVATNTPIKPWLVGEEQKTLTLCSQLKTKGIWTTAIRPPTVAKGSARLRLTLSATHSSNDVLTLVDALKASIKE